eukprot:TRINITY_DN600_c2_g1_i1.p1 TRINITY_DN600_c2_g1~~TRINITY_DN600_c2_g1_i1.p1  ORF type:complete len:612 (+),score=176.97 TRINITY_DN600_c2_g1_i1:86-1837(+)
MGWGGGAKGGDAGKGWDAGDSWGGGGDSWKGGAGGGDSWKGGGGGGDSWKGGGGGGDSWKGGGAKGGKDDSWDSGNSWKKGGGDSWDAAPAKSWDSGKGGWDAGKGGSWDSGKGASKGGWDGGKDKGGKGWDAGDSWDGGKGKDSGKDSGKGKDPYTAGYEAVKAMLGGKGKDSGKGWDSGKGGDAGYDSDKGWGGKGSWDDGGKGGGKSKGKDKGDGGPMALRLKFSGRENTPSDNLYITGIPAVVDEPTLQHMFESNGYTVQRTRIMQDAMGTGYSAACVQVGSTEEAQAAISQFTGQVIEVEGHGTGPPAQQKGGWGKAGKDGGKGGKGGPYGSDDGYDGMWDMMMSMMGGKGKDGKGKGKGKDSGKREKGGSKSTTQIMVAYAGRDHVPSDNLFVGNLPSAITEQAVRDMFANQGLTITGMKVLFDNHGKGTCSAMVRLTSQAEAEFAISLLNGTSVNAVPEAVAEQARRAAGGGGPGGPKPLHLKYSGRDNNPSENLYITGLPSAIDNATLIKMFTESGFTVMKSKVIYDEWGTGYSAGLVAVGSTEEATAAIQHFTGQVILLETEQGQSAGQQPPAQ